MDTFDEFEEILEHVLKHSSWEVDNFFIILQNTIESSDRDSKSRLLGSVRFIQKYSF